MKVKLNENMNLKLNFKKLERRLQDKWEKYNNMQFVIKFSSSNIPNIYQIKPAYKIEISSIIKGQVSTIEDELINIPWINPEKYFLNIISDVIDEYIMICLVNSMIENERNNDYEK
jgi:hypothetical protein